MLDNYAKSLGVPEGNYSKIMIHLIYYRST